MSLTINIYYTGENGNAKKFAEEMINSGIVDKIRNEEGNIRYNYFYSKEDAETVLLIDSWKDKTALDVHHKSAMMGEIANLREKYHLKMRVEQFTDLSHDYDEIIKRRTATRKFTDKKVEEDKLQKILEAGRLAPTAKNMQPQKIFVATTKESLEKLDTITPCRYNAPIVLIVCSNKNIAWTQDNYSTFEMDACIVATHMMLEATNQELDNIWIEMFEKNKLKTEFNIPENIEPICLIPLGYKDQTFKGNPLHNNRKELKETVEFI